MARSKFFQSIIFAHSIACTIPLVSSGQGCKVPLQSIKLKEANVSIGRYDAPDTIFLTLKRTTLDEPCVEPETRSATFSGIEMVGHPEEPERPSPTETSPIPRTLDPCGLGASWTLDVPDDLDRNVDSAVIQIADTCRLSRCSTGSIPFSS
ncbi:MAG: hypothetical protein IT381_26085 [Deltaproteobacteria bacterium]|nr:hypothetical protein [Deltaproteobacteria bacterium]